MNRAILTTLLLATLTLAPGAMAAEAAAVAIQSAPSRPSVRVNLTMEPAPEAERADHEAYLAALTDFNARGFAALEPHLAGLREALTHAPPTYPVMVETNGGWLVRTDSREDARTLAGVIGAIQQERGGGEVKVVARPGVYPRIAFLLGSEAIERRKFDEANAFLDAGLALHPLDRLLLNEKLVALHAEQRWDDAYLLLKDAFAAEDPVLTARPAHLQRRLGYTLVELGRLREAREAYEASLVADPGNATALQELEFIDNAEAGRPNYGEVVISAPLAPRPEGQQPDRP